MTSTILRRSAGSAVLLLALTSMAGCGGGDDDSTATDNSSESTSAATSEATTQSSETPESSAPAAEGGDVDPSEFVDAYSAALDQATTAQIAFDISGGQVPTKLDGVADFTTTPPSFQFDLDDPTTGKTQTTVLADGAVYVPEPGKPGRYLKTDLTTNPLGSGGIDFLDPDAAIDTLSKALTSASLSPDEDVDGETFDHYTIDVDTQTLLDASGPGGEDLPEGTLPDTLTYEMYFDGDGFLREVTADLGAQAGSVDATFDQWGEPVDIAVPDPSKVDTTPGG